MDLNRCFWGFYFAILVFTSDYIYMKSLNLWLQAVDYGVHKLWERNNVGVCLYFSCFDSTTFLCFYIVILNHVLCNWMLSCCLNVNDCSNRN